MLAVVWPFAQCTLCEKPFSHMHKQEVRKEKNIRHMNRFCRSVFFSIKCEYIVILYRFQLWSSFENHLLSSCRALYECRKNMYNILYVYCTSTYSVECILIHNLCCIYSKQTFSYFLKHKQQRKNDEKKMNSGFDEWELELM